jgi:hypothetical protein
MATEVRDHKKMLAKDRKEAEKRVGPGSVVFDLVVPSYPVHLTLAQLITPLHPRPRTVCTVQLRRVLHRCTLALAPCAPYSCNGYYTVAPSPSHPVPRTVAMFIPPLHPRPRTVCTLQLRRLLDCCTLALAPCARTLAPFIKPMHRCALHRGTLAPHPVAPPLALVFTPLHLCTPLAPGAAGRKRWRVCGGARQLLGVSVVQFIVDPRFVC